MTCFLNIHSTANLDSGYNAYVQGLVSKLGRNFAGIRKNYGPDNSPIISPEITWAIQQGRPWIYQNGKPNATQSDLTAHTFWKSIGAGKYDAIFTKFFNTIKADSRWTPQNPFHYSWHHEQTSLAEAPAGKYAGSAADYIAAHKHVWQLLINSGAHVSVGGNMKLCFVPNEVQIARDPKYGSGTPSSNVAPYVVSKIDPGPQYYDHVGMDFYLKTTSNWKPSDWTALHKWANTVGKSFMTGEFGIASTKNPAAFLAGLDTLLKTWGAGTGPGQVYALCCTSRVAAGGDFRWDVDYRSSGSGPIFTAWKKLANDPFYSAHV